MKKIIIGTLLAVSVSFAVGIKGTAAKSINIDNSRAVLIRGEVEEYNIQHAIQQFNKFAAASKQPVYLILNSPGGSVLDGFELVNTLEVLEEKGVKTICVIETMAYSMAAILAAYCQETYIHKFASILHHQASYGVRGNQSQVTNRVLFTDDYLDELSADVAKRLKMSPEVYRAKIHNDWWLTASQALKAGLVKGIVNTVSYTVAAPERPKSFSFFMRGNQIVYHPLDVQTTSP